MSVEQRTQETTTLLVLSLSLLSFGFFLSLPSLCTPPQNFGESTLAATYRAKTSAVDGIFDIAAALPKKNGCWPPLLSNHFTYAVMCDGQLRHFIIPLLIFSSAKFGSIRRSNVARVSSGGPRRSVCILGGCSRITFIFIIIRHHFTTAMRML